MKTKPYSLQSPEQIAKDYAGNKQKIAMAAQSGLLDPTAAVMAGMFIDRMRSAQGQEQGPPSTVAQQVFAPPPPPMQMGAMSPGASPMGAPRPPMAAPPPQGAPPVGMAGGGLTTLPLPDNMFNEPDGMGYAGGGIVAFADGGEAEEPAPIGVGEMLQRMFNPTTEQLREARADTIAAGREGRARREAEEIARAARRAPPAPFRSRDQNPNTPAQEATRYVPKEIAPLPAPPAPFRSRDQAPTTPAQEATRYRPKEGIVAPRPAPGVSMSQLQAALAGGITPRPAAPAAAGVAPASAAPRVAPTPAPPRVGVPSAPRVGGVAPAGPALSASPAAASGAVQPPAPTGAAAVLAELQALAPQDRTMRDTMAKRYADMSSPEALAAQKKQDFWGSLAQIGFGMAGSNSPYFLQAAGQAASAALPGMQQAAQARKAQEMTGLQGQLGIENLTNQERQALAARAAELSEMRRKGQIDEQQFNAQMALKREELEVDRDYKRGMVAAAGARASSGGSGRAKATGPKPLTRAQALALVNGERDSSRMTTEQKLARADALIAASSGAAPAAGAVRVYDPKTGTFR
jgi:hypothetical protein